MQWRNPDLVADPQLVIGFAALAVNSDLALSYDSIHTRARYVVEAGNEKIVEALIDIRQGYFDHPDGYFLMLN